ncbi:MAG: hypothetical protein ACTS27_11720, partial [Phycisphaerales bacterium]
ALLTALAAALALAAMPLSGCKPERSGVTTDPAESAPAKDDLQPAPAAEEGASSAAPAINATQGGSEVDPDAATFTVAGLDFRRPDGWTLATPGPMRAAELVNAGVPEGAIVFTHFGPRGAGAVADHLTRWARQVQSDTGEPTLPTVTEMTSEVGGVTREITFARYEGTYMSGPPGQTPTPMPGTLFLGAIVEGGPQGTVYMRAFGPAEQMRPHVDAVVAMLLAEPQP